MKPKGNESGFALLMVFVMAAMIAISLYYEMPRVAFESQRVKEQLLIDRGEQYKRGIQIFVRKNKRFPATLDELESFQNTRFLRRRYKDPMTGKEEWRLIHANAAGVLTDSLVQKQNPATAGKDGKSANGSTATGGQMTMNADPGFAAQTGANGQPAVPDPVTGLNMATARRPSDFSPTGVPGQLAGPPSPNLDPNQPPAPQPYQGQGQVQQYPGQPPQFPGQAQQYPGQVQQYPGQGQAQQYPGQPPQFPGQPPQFPGRAQFPLQPGQVPVMPGQQGYVPGQVLQPGQQNPYGQPTGIQPYNPNNPNPNQQVSSNPGGFVQPGAFQGQVQGQFQGQPQTMQGDFSGISSNPSTSGSTNANGQNPAINAIQQAIFSPRQQQPNGMNSGMNGTSGGGIAGVATTYKGPAIKVVNERKKYQEWEFVYDMSKDKSVVGNAAAAGQQMPPGQNGPGGTGAGFGTFGGGNSTGTGSNTGGFGSGSTSGFGSSAPAQPPQPTQQP